MKPRIPSVLAMALATGAVFVLSASPAYANAPAANSSFVQDDDGPTAGPRYGNWRTTSNNFYPQGDGSRYQVVWLEQYVYWPNGSVTKRYRKIERVYPDPRRSRSYTETVTTY